MSGKIDISQLNTPPEKHELATARIFADMDKDIAFILPSGMPDNHRPDFVMDGVEWEVKCPNGKSDRTIETNMRTAMKQSQYIIFDLRRIKVPEKKCLSQLKYFYDTKPRIRRLYIIKKNQQLIKWSKD